MNILLKISRFIDNLSDRLGKITSALVLVMVVIGVGNVFLGYIGKIIGRNIASNVYIEAQWYIFDIFFFLGAAYVLKHNEHVRVDIFYSKQNPQRKALINLLGTIFFLIPFCILIIDYSWDYVANSWIQQEISPSPDGLPRYPIKSFIIIGFAILFIQGISEAIKNLAIVTGRLEPPNPERNPQSNSQQANSQLNQEPNQEEDNGV
ncbi:MAG: TRAP transporter small permease subunit [Cyanobacteria bacterium P01_A01_bin.45]